MERKPNRSAIISKHMLCTVGLHTLLELSKCSHVLLKFLPQASCRSFAKAPQRLSARASWDKKHVWCKRHYYWHYSLLIYNPVLLVPIWPWLKERDALSPGLSSCLDASLYKGSGLLRRQGGSCLPLQAGGCYVETPQWSMVSRHGGKVGSGAGWYLC